MANTEESDEKVCIFGTIWDVNVLMILVYEITPLIAKYISIAFHMLKIYQIS